MKITILCVGKLKEEYWRGAAAEYAKRVSGYCDLRIVELADEKIPKNASPAVLNRIMQKETEAALANIPKKDFVVALDLSGAAITSAGLAEMLSEQMGGGVSGFSFVIGASLGFAPSMLERADCRISVSKMTFPHQLMRVMLMEQIYRAFKILRREAYHK